MKIVFLVSQWPIDGGIESVTRTLANEMVWRGHIVYVLYTSYYFPPSSGVFVDDRIIERQIPVISGCPKEEVFRKASEFVNSLYLEVEFNVIINQCYPTWSSVVLKELKGRAKIIECFHMRLFPPSRYKRLKWKGWDLKMRLCGPWIFNRVEKKHQCEKIEREIQNVDRFVLLAESYVKEYTKIRGNRFVQGKLTYMHNPLAQKEILTDLDFQRKENVVLCVSRMFESVKRISYMINLWAKIEKDGRFDNWRFDVVGDGPSLNTYKEMAVKVGLNRITFWGYQNPERFYRQSKILLMTSVTEGWPMTILEAQQCGVVPIVLNTFSSVRELIVDGYNGRIANSMRSFFCYLKDTMLRQTKWNLMAKTSMDTCKQFSAPRIVDEWEKLIDSI